MKRRTSIAAITGLAISAIAAGGHIVAAQQTDRLNQRSRQSPTQTTDRGNLAQQSRDVGGARAGRLDDRTSGPNVRASQLIGMNIKNPQNEDVGEVNDLVINSRTGRIGYAAVTYGGFLGLGDKLFAVPFEAFQYKADPDDSEATILVLDVTQRQLEGAKGFDEDNWPNFADRVFTSEIDRRYGVNRNRSRQTRGEVDVDVDRDGVNVGVNRDGADRSEERR